MRSAPLLVLVFLFVLRFDVKAAILDNEQNVLGELLEDIPKGMKVTHLVKSKL